jgi:hypothetical protein
MDKRLSDREVSELRQALEEVAAHRDLLQKEFRHTIERLRAWGNLQATTYAEFECEEEDWTPVLGAVEEFNDILQEAFVKTL